MGMKYSLCTHKDGDAYSGFGFLVNMEVISYGEEGTLCFSISKHAFLFQPPVFHIISPSSKLLSVHVELLKDLLFML